MEKILFLLIISLPNFLFSQSAPFQVLVAKKASVYGESVLPLQYIDDVTSIEIEDGGFISLVHQGGTTYEINETIFTFYLKPELLKERVKRPMLERLYSDSLSSELATNLKVLYPPFDRSGLLSWHETKPVKIYWNQLGTVASSYVVTLSHIDGKKIQDLRTGKPEIELKAYDYGLTQPIFAFKITNKFAGETSESKTYSISLKASPDYPTKAADLVLKALDLEQNSLQALETWEELLSMQNGEQYLDLYKKFLGRHAERLSSAGKDVQQLLLQNR